MGPIRFELDLRVRSRRGAALYHRSRLLQRDRPVSDNLLRRASSLGDYRYMVQWVVGRLIYFGRRFGDRPLSSRLSRGRVHGDEPSAILLAAGFEPQRQMADRVRRDKLYRRAGSVLAGPLL